MLTKALPARVKALEGDDIPAGSFEAVVAAYNVDSVGDKIVPGAFKKTLADWKQSGSDIPVIWSHQHTDAFAHIGSVTEASETDDGLVVKGMLDIEDNPTAKQVYKLIKGGRIRNYSFAYDINDSEDVSGKSEDYEGADLLLKELGLLEVGPCLVGANRDTRTLGVKSARQKAVQGSYEQLQQAICDALDTQYSSDDTWAYPVATFSDSVVYRVSGASGPGQFQADYSLNDDGSVSLGDPKKVNMVEQVVAVGDGKNAGTADKAGRTLSAANETAIRTALQAMQNGIEKLEAVLGVTDDDDTAASDDGKTQTVEPTKDDEEPDAKAKAEEQKAKSEESTPAVPVESLDAELQLLGLAQSA